MHPSTLALQEALSALQESFAQRECSASLIDDLSALLLSIQKSSSETSITPRLCGIGLWMCEHFSSHDDEDLDKLRAHIKTLRASLSAVSTAA